MTSRQVRFTTEELGSLSRHFEGGQPQEVLRWALGEFHPDILLACSFGGASGMALVDMAAQVRPDVRVFYLDTGFLFPETYELRDEVERRYGIKVEAYESRWSPEAQAREFGEELWSRDPDLCCQLRKVEPNQRALEGARAWISGLRRDQASTRADTPVVQWDESFGVVKVNPLAAWTEEQVWEYVREHNVPYNPLVDRGYKSIGCTHCTRPVRAGEDPRAGRWSGFSKTECGLHVPLAEKNPG
ncbi:MAG: phosphoadenylyl-sulfate reductase [Chloroflexi bacterium]|nr:phosphoadenylyl-sulfate reductase [Chloroflexota bacterium]